MALGWPQSGEKGLARKKEPRGRRPSISAASAHAGDLRRQLKTLITHCRHLEKRLLGLDVYYRSFGRREKVARHAKTRGLRGRGPNIREVSYRILKSSGKPMALRTLAEQVVREKKGQPGEYFAQNLGVALTRDRRFKRVEPGVYGLRGA